MRTAVLAGLPFLLVACSAGPRPASLPPSTRIAVEDFQVASDASIRNFEGGPLDQVGPKVTEAVVRSLQARQIEATRVPVGLKSDASLTLSGWVTKVDGGSLGGRRARAVLWILCWPCALATMNTGAGHVTVEGEASRDDGTVAGTFRAEGKGGGASHDHAMTQASLRIGREIADMVYFGRYNGGPGGANRTVAQPVPSPRPAAEPPPTTGKPSSRDVADRLRELEALRRDGLISEREYMERRRQILDSL